MQLWIGTSGYSYRDWVGGFYPSGTPPRRMFAHYSAQFSLVELNYTFYRSPARDELARLADKAPAGFQFVVKLHRSLSHEHDLAGAGAFRDAAAVLEQSHRLLMLLCQYPQRFHCDSENMAQLEALADRFAGHPLAVEFRHNSWNRPEIPDWLRAHGLHLVSVDVPAIPALYPTRLVQSSRTIYLRLHSRRAESWYQSDKERYDYLFSDEELLGWLHALAERQEAADRAFVLFNNCHRGQAAVNAIRIRELVEQNHTAFQVVQPFATSGGQRLLF